MPRVLCVVDVVQRQSHGATEAGTAASRAGGRSEGNKHAAQAHGSGELVARFHVQSIRADMCASMHMADFGVVSAADCGYASRYVVMEIHSEGLATRRGRG